MSFDRKQIGRIGLSMAIAYFTSKGYTVSIPMNDTQWYDLVIEKDGVFETVQCKGTETETKTVDLRSTGGTKGSVYDNVTHHKNLSYLFCVDKELSMWCIPMKDLLESGNKNTIVLRKELTANNQGFQTYKYLVDMRR
jgi:hypothetical protein